MSGVDVEKTLETLQKRRQLPKPVGYKVLCMVPKYSEFYESGVVKSDKTREYDELLTNILFVVDMGAMCYTDPQRYPHGPWCKIGDFIIVRANTGTRIRIYEEEFRILNDDSVEGVIDDPRAVRRIL